MNTILSTLTVIIRRGSGRYESASITDEAYDVALRKIAEQAFAILSERGARETALRGLMMLEDEEIFNAGTGSKLQQDGKARMSEAFMDGSTGRLGAVINVENIPHPLLGICFWREGFEAAFGPDRMGEKGGFPTRR